MELIEESDCSRCKHFDYDKSFGNMVAIYCTAFPDGDGIPYELATGEVLHRTPYPGDHGIQFEEQTP